MRLLPKKYTDIEKSLPIVVSLKSPIFAYYESPVTKEIKKVKVLENTSFSISAIPDKIYAQGEDVFVNSDLIVIKGVTAGKKGRVFGKFKYSDLAKNAIIRDAGSKKYKPITRSLLIFGIPRQMFFVALGSALILGGVYYLKKKK